MPVTFRLVVHTKEGMQRCIDYIEDVENDYAKTEISDPEHIAKNLNGELNYIQRESATWVHDKDGRDVQLISGLHCRPSTASDEMYLHLVKYNKHLDDVVGYHTIQSFSWDDPVTPTEVHRMGVELAKLMYPNFKSVVTTHVDKGHLHNHIFTVAVDEQGKKMRNDHYKSSTSLTRLREVSDSVALPYGCRIIEDAPIIGLKKSKKVPSYMASFKQTWTSQIKKDITRLKEKASSFDELLYLLSNEGYQIKRGKSISVKPYGCDEFRKLDRLGEGYSQKELTTYYAYSSKNYIKLNVEEKYKKITTDPNKLSDDQKQLDGRIKNIQESLDYTEPVLKAEREYPIYSKKANSAKAKLERLRENMVLMDQFNIYSFNDLVKQEERMRQEIEKAQEQIDAKINAQQKNMEMYNLCRLYLMHYNKALLYMDEAIPKEDREQFKEDYEIYREAKEALNDWDLDQVRDFKLSYDKQQKGISQEMAQLSYRRYEAHRLTEIRQSTLDQNENFIKSIQFSKRMIDFDKSDDAYYYIRLPYTQMYTKILKQSVCWKTDERAQYYVVADDIYTIYDSNGNEFVDVQAEDLTELVNSSKRHIDSLYAEGESAVQDKEQKNKNTFLFTVDAKMFDDSKESESYYRIRIPYSKEWIDVPKENAAWIKQDKTCQFVLDDKTYVNVYSGDYEKSSDTILHPTKVEELRSHFEQKQKEYQSLHQ